jgi:hypothetical protein
MSPARQPEAHTLQAAALVSQAGARTGAGSQNASADHGILNGIMTCKSELLLYVGGVGK